MIDPIIFYDEDGNKIKRPQVPSRVLKPAQQTTQETNKLINPIIIDESPKDFEQKIYLVLYIDLDDSESENKTGWKACVGRSETYRFIQSIADNIDIHRSKVLAETKKEDIESGTRGYYFLNLDKSLSIYGFCKNIAKYYPRDNFDIEVYNFLDDDEIEEHTVSDIPGYRSAVNPAHIQEAMDIWEGVLNGEVVSSVDDMDFDPNNPKYNI